MRIVFSILLFLIFAARPMVQLSSVLYYQLNIDTIVANYCVNKDKPVLQCHGKCYLSNKLQLQNPSSEFPEDYAAISLESFIPAYFQDNAQFLVFFNAYWDVVAFCARPMIVPLDVLFRIEYPPEFS